MNLFDNPYARMIPPTAVERGDVIAVNHTANNTVSIVLLAHITPSKAGVDCVGFKVTNDHEFSSVPLAVGLSEKVTAVKLIGKAVDINGSDDPVPVLTIDTFGGTFINIKAVRPNSNEIKDMDAMIDSINKTMSKLGVNSVTIDGETDLHGQPLQPDEPEKKPERPMSDVTFKRSIPCINSVFEQLYGEDILIKEKPE